MKIGKAQYETASNAVRFSVRPRGRRRRLRAATLPMPIHASRCGDRRGVKKTFPLEEKLQMLSAYLCDGRERERDLETAREEGDTEEGRETSNRVAALLPYYDGILSPRGSGVPDWPDEKNASSHIDRVGKHLLGLNQ